MSVSGQSNSSAAGLDLKAAAGARVIVCVTGGIAAYKTAMVVSRLAQAGAQVTVAMTVCPPSSSEGMVSCRSAALSPSVLSTWITTFGLVSPNHSTFSCSIRHRKL